MISSGAQLRASADHTATAVRGGVATACLLGFCGMEMLWAVTAQAR